MGEKFSYADETKHASREYGKAESRKSPAGSWALNLEASALDPIHASALYSTGMSAPDPPRPQAQDPVQILSSVQALASDQIQPSSEQSVIAAQSQVYVVEKHLTESTPVERVQCDSHGSHPIKSETTRPSRSSFEEQMPKSTQISALVEGQGQVGPRWPSTDARETSAGQIETITHNQAGSPKPGEFVTDSQSQALALQTKGKRKPSSKWPPEYPVDEGASFSQGQPKPSKWPPKPHPDNNKTSGENQAKFTESPDSKVVKNEDKGPTKWSLNTPQVGETKSFDQDRKKTSVQETGKMSPANIQGKVPSSKWPPKSSPNDSKIEGQGEAPASNRGKQVVKNGGKTPTKTQSRAFRKWPPEPSSDDTGTEGQTKTPAKSGPKDSAPNSGRPSLRKTSAKWRQITAPGETSQFAQQGTEEQSPNPAKTPFKKPKWPPPSKDQDLTPYQSTGKTPRKDEPKKLPRGF